MTARHEVTQQRYGGLGDFRLIEELHDDRKIDIEPQDVVGAHFSACAEAGDGPKHCDGLYGVPLLKQGKISCIKRLRFP